MKMVTMENVANITQNDKFQTVANTRQVVPGKKSQKDLKPDQTISKAILHPTNCKNRLINHWEFPQQLSIRGASTSPTCKRCWLLNPRML